MKQWIKCMIGAHEYEILEKHSISNVHKEPVAVVYVSKCKHCGKIITKKVSVSNLI